MATTNVFGTPVIVGTRLERAFKALSDPNAEGKRDAAVAYVRRQKQIWGNGVSTLCVFYNATGESLAYSESDSWYGSVYDSYPIRVQNGQWGAFFHVKATAAASGSVGLVVYRVKSYVSDKFCKQVLCWETPWNQLSHGNHAYCDIFDDAAVIKPADVYQSASLTGRQHAVWKLGMFTSVTIESGTSPLFEALLTIEVIAARREVDAEAKKEVHEIDAEANKEVDAEAKKEVDEVDADSSAPPTNIN